MEEWDVMGVGISLFSCEMKVKHREMQHTDSFKGPQPKERGQPL